MNKKFKIAVDFLMVALLPALMAFQITGRELHEWFGIGMLMLLLIHNILNFKWYKKLFKGRYTFLRTLQAVFDIFILVGRLCLGYSGIIMSGYVFSFVSVNGQMALARQMHMAASYWGFVLMSIHLGFHWGIAVRAAGKKFRYLKLPVSVLWIMRIVTAAIAGYGAFCFYKADIVSYLFLDVQFAFYDFGRPGISVFEEYIAIMVLFVFFGYYLVKWLNKITLLKRKRKVV